MKRALTILLVIGFVRLAPAAPPTDQSISEMMNVMQLETLLNQALKQMMDGMAKAMDKGLEQSTKDKSLSAAQKTAIESYRKKFTSTVTEELSFAKVKDIYTRAYRDSFSQDEVNGVIAFYKSPAGKAIVEKNPQVMQKANDLMQARLGPLSQKLQTMQEDFVKQLGPIK